MADRIRVLDDALADQIAAGEVVERPASVVKELVENAIDASARSIRVEIEGGGTRTIRVSDDGEGMSPPDAERCVRRHATSKIATLEDLSAIRTLGFRGEALPSIASVSRFELTTRTRDAIEGTRVAIDAGGEANVRAVGCAPGTTVSVRELFYNVPARRKFLKAIGTESAHCAEVCRRAALATEGVRVTFVRDGRTSFEVLPTDSLAKRAAMIFAESLSGIEGIREGVTVRAMLAAPEKARSGATGLHLFVNRRAVRDRALARSIAFAYGSVLPPGRYPAGVVYVEIDPSEVDVNVHPQKAEVRFARGREVLDAITRIVASGLGTSAWRGPPRRGADFWQQRLPSGPVTPPETAEAEPDPWGLAPTTALGETSDDPRSGDRSSGYARGFDPRRGEGFADRATDSREPPALAPRDPRAADPRPYGGPTGAIERVAEGASESTLLDAGGFFGSLRVLGQARRMLIVCEGRDGLYILDQHAADERVRFDRLRKSFAARSVAMQGLLVPERVELTEREVAIAEERKDVLLSCGLDVAVIGERTIAVHGVPALVRKAPPARLIRDVLTELEHSGERAFGDAIDMALATMACHGAIRAGDPLSIEECRALLASIDEVADFSGHCPHGRPVVHDVPFGELERKLGR